ncbi:MAG: NAD(P)H-hydrate dehydratase [Prevotella sp.]|nr:NAD(P)H-hydrate dehydratase [Alistipes senegalensis]MCM1357882.1 NAD(P)H-hydrate dehydratase [Prevotella sp.]MCM1472754.1 NAD(P)H-hydrate dehydratase [Muribaculaceae bacterium]
MRIVTPEQMRIIEDNSEKYGVSKGRLMVKAGYKLARLIDYHCRNNLNKKIVFIAGAGNNAGDCFVAAELLTEVGYKNISVLMVCGMPKTELAKEMYNDITECVKITNDYKQCLPQADIIIDGVFGTGFHGELDKNIADIFRINPKAYRIAVDVPSGVNSLKGTVSEGAFKANETLTFGFIKIGMTQYPARDLCGTIRVVDIGIPENAEKIQVKSKKYSLIDRKELKNFPPERKSTAHKGTFGKVLVIAGSNTMRGAAFFAVSGALRSGAGLVQLATTGKCINTVSMLAPEATFIEVPDNSGYMHFNPNIIDLKKYDAVVIGCGMGLTPETVKLTKFVVENSEVPVIIDADGINCIASDIDILLRKRADIILTPHIGEMARLLKCPVKEVSDNRLRSAERFIAKYKGVTIVLKGAGTIVADRGHMAVNPTGNAGMSRGGSGDILAGMIGAVAGQGYNAFDSACAGVYLHGLAGDIAARKFTREAMLPRDILNCLSDSFRKIK